MKSVGQWHSIKSAYVKLWFSEIFLSAVKGLIQRCKGFCNFWPFLIRLHLRCILVMCYFGDFFLICVYKWLQYGRLMFRFTKYILILQRYMSWIEILYFFFLIHSIHNSMNLLVTCANYFTYQGLQRSEPYFVLLWISDIFWFSSPFNLPVQGYEVLYK